jgi:hypothetical protein
MFYELELLDPLGNTPWKRSDEISPPGTVQATIDQWAQITLLIDPDAKLKGAEAAPVRANMRTVSEKAIGPGWMPRLLPDGYHEPYSSLVLIC